MKYRDFEIIRDKTRSGSAYNVVKWVRQGVNDPLEGKVIARLVASSCGDWRFSSVGTNLLDYYEDGLIEFIRDYLRILTVYNIT